MFLDTSNTELFLSWLRVLPSHQVFSVVSCFRPRVVTTPSSSMGFTRDRVLFRSMFCSAEESAWLVLFLACYFWWRLLHYLLVVVLCDEYWFPSCCNSLLVSTVGSGIVLKREMYCSNSLGLGCADFRLWKVGWRFDARSPMLGTWK